MPERAIPVHIRRAIVARAYGAGDLLVARYLGRYPVPHDDLDKVEQLLKRIPNGYSLADA